MGGIIGKDFKYKKIKFLEDNEIELFKNYTIIRHRYNQTNFDWKQSPVGDTMFHGDALADSILLTKLKLMERETGLELLPTYSFWRMYSFGSDLKEHTDIPACQISVTVMLGRDGTPWHIYMEDEGEVEKSSKKKTTSKKDKPLRKDRFDREEEAIKDILFRVDAKGKKPKEEGDYTKDNPAEGSMLFAKDEMLAKYKEIKTKEDDPKKTLEEYNKLLTEKNEEFKDAIEKFVEEFEKNGITMSDIYGEKLSDTIKNLQERLKLGINKARAGVEEEARGMRREVALTEMTRDQHLRLLEIVKENGISLREGTDHVKVYYEIAKAAYLGGVANALKL